MSIITENALAGSPDSEYLIAGAGDLANLGFCREFSVNVGETATFSCHGSGTLIDIYRIGYYSGLGWRKVASITNTPATQPDPIVVEGTNGGTSCTNWSVTASWAVPADTTSGLFIGVFRNAAGNNASWIPFVVRDDNLVADIIVKTSDTTWALAYNFFGTMASPLSGKSYYGANGPLGDAYHRAHYATYHKPIVTRAGVAQTYWTNAEQPLIRWLERNGHNVKYVSSKDVDRTPSVLNNSKIVISSGHDEYYSDGMRNALEAYRDSGKHLIFMSANEVFWRIRFDPQRDGAYCYKDTMHGPGDHFGGTPLDPVSWTGTWKDTRWAERKPENTLTGTDFRMNGVNDKDVTLLSSAAFAQHPVWRNSNLRTSDQTLTGVVGFEADAMLPVQQSPRAVILAAQDYDLQGIYANDNGQEYSGTGLMNWGIISQRYPSGAIVVGFGTVQWAWALDSVHERQRPAANSAARQFTINLLHDLGASPATPMAGMVVSQSVHLNEYGFLPEPVSDDNSENAPSTRNFWGDLFRLTRRDGSELQIRTYTEPD